MSNTYIHISFPRYANLVKEMHNASNVQNTPGIACNRVMSELSSRLKWDKDPFNKESSYAKDSGNYWHDHDNLSLKNKNKLHVYI